MENRYFSPSINILRDHERSIDYIPTRNGERAFQKISSAFSQGTKSFNIIGAYGSGKSAFILALENVLNKKNEYFPNPFEDKIDSFDTVFIVGEYSSFKDIFCETLNISKSDTLFNGLYKSVEKKAKSKVGLLIVVDEFGKFLEYAAKESPEEELYFIQQLAEFANSGHLPILFITTLHQAFEDYALSLTKTQKKEWEKVKGRLVEISFNEPVEQLLFLASERISQKSFKCSIELSEQRQLFKAIQIADAFPMKDFFKFEFAQKIFPFDILSASIVTLAFQRYGQNERSLFSFLESDDYLGLNDFKEGNEFYHIAHIYDYLRYNFHSFLNSSFNPDFAQWKALDEAIQRAESAFDERFDDATQILKTIGLVSIFGRQGQKITREFLNTYASIALHIDNADEIIEVLESKQIIRFRDYSQRYVLFKGTDFNLNLELELAEDQVSRDFSIVYHLQKHFNFPIVPAKRTFFKIGTPRYFVFEITENPIHKVPEGQVDGFINLIFNNLLQEDKIKKLSEDTDEAILYGWFQNSDEISKQLFDIEKIQIAKSKCIDDQIASAELESFLLSSKEKLNSLFQASFFGNETRVIWYFGGKPVSFGNAKQMNLFLSSICETIYFETPTFRNELMNREKVSGTISLAKKNLIEHIIDSVSEENIGLDADRFPPEKTIYLSLLKRTGIHQYNGSIYQLDKPTDETFIPLWKASESFLNDCSVASRKLNEFIELLKTKPFKLKQGFIDFWIPIYLLAKQKHFAFYEEGVFIPDITADTLELAMKQPQKYHISTFNLDENRLNIFNRYRYFLNMIEESSPNSDSFIETIKPFLVFYKRLAPYTKLTKQLGKDALRLREAISLATDPEKVFFEDIPRALSFTLNDFSEDQKLEDFSIALQASTRELSAAFTNLVNRLEEIISTTISDELIGFPENKIRLQQRFKNIKKENIDVKLRVLIQRINTPLDDRQSWISSIATALMGKSLDQFTDDDESGFRVIFPKRIHELDNLTEISRKDIDETKEEILKLELTSFVKGVQRNLIRMPKKQMELINSKKEAIQKMLYADDRHSNIALLIKLLQEEIGDE